MPATFITDWKKIGQSGPTIDGRNIEPQWLIDAAESYDQATYTAVIWVDHFRFYGNMGKVVELKTEREGDIVSLYARLQPNGHLLAWNKEQQKLYTSMELTPDFAGSGKCYLSGLAVTDQPASLGTHELHFKSRLQTPESFVLCGVELDSLRDLDGDAALPQWLTSLLGALGINSPHSQGATSTEEETMTEEQIKQFAELVGENVGKKIDEMQAQLAKHFSAPTDEPAPAPAKDDSSAPGTIDLAASVAEAVKPLADKLDELSARFEQARPGTAVPETTNPAGEAGLV